MAKSTTKSTKVKKERKIFGQPDVVERVSKDSAQQPQAADSSRPGYQPISQKEADDRAKN
jgi:hypothetical protein